MTNSHTPNPEYHSPGSGERGSSQRILLLVLVLLLAAFGYLYFFTGLIRSPEEAPKLPTAQTAQVKQPIPPRPEVQGEKPAAPAKSEEQKPVAAPTTPAPTPPAKPAAAPAAPAAPAASVAKPAATPAPAPAKPAKSAEQQVAKAPAQPAPASAKTPEQKVAKPAAAAKTAPKEVKPVAKEGRGAYTLLIGDFALGKSVKAAQAKLKKAAIAPVAKKSVKRQEPMNRLFLAEFSGQDAAQAEMERLKKLTADAFVLQENGKYAVYAGSYYLEGPAAVEQDRLYDKGVKLVMKKATAPITVTRLTAGSFATKEEARKAAARLKKQGLAAQVVKAGK